MIIEKAEIEAGAAFPVEKLQEVRTPVLGKEVRWADRDYGVRRMVRPVSKPLRSCRLRTSRAAVGLRPIRRPDPALVPSRYFNRQANRPSIS